MRKMFVALKHNPDKEQSPSSQSFSHILSPSYSSSFFLVHVFVFLDKEMELSLVFQCKFSAEEIYFTCLLCCWIQVLKLWTLEYISNSSQNVYLMYNFAFRYQYLFLMFKDLLHYDQLADNPGKELLITFCFESCLPKAWASCAWTPWSLFSWQWSFRGEIRDVQLLKTVFSGAEVLNQSFLLNNYVFFFSSC